MRSDVHGGAKKYAILSSGVGFNPTTDGERQRKLVRGRMITDQTYQINMLVTKEVRDTIRAKLDEINKRERALDKRERDLKLLQADVEQKLDLLDDTGQNPYP
jgi:small subunit ribosomal protein S6e